jgi:allantoinase
MLSGDLQKARLGGTPWALRSRRVVTPERQRAATIVVHGPAIVAVEAFDADPACPLLDVGEQAVLPGLIDMHVHINEPGRTDWEGFTTATRAAAAGGVTTLIDMPLNSSPVTTTVAAFREKLAAAQGKLWVGCGFYGGVVPGNAAEIGPLIAAGVVGFKAFLCHSGIDDFPAATEGDLASGLAQLKGTSLPLLAHAEIVEELPADVVERFRREPRSYPAYLASRPRAWEHTAIRLLIELCGKYRSRVHIVHLAAADALPMIFEAKNAGLPLTVETCPHYLAFAAEEVPDGDPRFKCAPPIRERDDRERLWAALGEGLIDTIGSDHSPAPPELKHLTTGDFRQAWGGIASLQLSLPVVWTEAARRGRSLADVVRWMATHPARLIALDDRKGAIAPGLDADLVVFDPDAEWTVVGHELQHRHKATPYDGRRLRGRVETTFLRGQAVYDAGTFAAAPTGQALVKTR